MRNICYCKQVMIKNKNFLEQSFESITEAGKNLGIVIMTAAVVTGIMELPNQLDTKFTLLNEPILAFNSSNTANDNPVRREKESTETSPVQISYSATQRTPARSIRIK